MSPPRPWCSSCGAPILWSTTRNGRATPLNPEPSRRGNVRVLADGSCVVLADPELSAFRETGEDLYLSHFATCPNAGQHRRRGRRT